MFYRFRDSTFTQKKSIYDMQMAYNQYEAHTLNKDEPKTERDIVTALEGYAQAMDVYFDLADVGFVYPDVLKTVIDLYDEQYAALDPDGKHLGSIEVLWTPVLEEEIENSADLVLHYFGPR